MERTHRTSPRRAARALLTLLALLASAGSAGAQAPTAFTYQGRLTDAGSPAAGQYDFEFRLFDGSGTQLGSVQTREGVAVTNGVFLVRLDFGSTPFVPGAPASTLEIGVRPGASTAAFTTLAPRQPITATPYAVQTINAEMLGGVPASQYVKTDDPRLTDGGPPAPGSTHYIQNTTTQQPDVSFNIGGNGLFGGAVGIGTQTPTAGMRLEVNGDAMFTTAAGNRIQVGTPNSETGMSLRRPGFGRADIRFDGATLKLAAGADAGPPAGANGVTVTTSGSVGVGTESPTVGKLHVVGGPGQPAVYGETANRGVWGKSTGSSYGVYGESGSGIGVQGVSTSNIGVGGISTSNFGVAGSSATSIGVVGQTGSGGAESPGVKGVSTGAGGVGVRGDGTTGVYGVSAASGGVGVTGQANNGNSIGVFGTTTGGTGVRGESTSATGFGLYAKNPTGYAMYAEGNAGQAPNKGGLVKAMIKVNADGTIARCFNSQLPDGGASLPPSGNDGCGFRVSAISDIPGSYSIDFRFPFYFFAVTPGLSGSVSASASATQSRPGDSGLSVHTFVDGRGINDGAYADFTVIVF